ncbi:MAG TPA: hypothetical protein VGB52_04960 [Actinomycetota bacterium]
MEELLFEFRAQRDVLLRHFEAIDSKAGILLGFAAAIATLGPAQGPLAPAGRATAIASAISALAAFVPRRFPSFQPTAPRRIARRPHARSTRPFARLLTPSQPDGGGCHAPIQVTDVGGRLQLDLDRHGAARSRYHPVGRQDMIDKNKIFDREAWKQELGFDPDEIITSIENLTGERLDVTGEPLWKRIWFKILRIA